MIQHDNLFHLQEVGFPADVVGLEGTLGQLDPLLLAPFRLHYNQLLHQLLYLRVTTQFPRVQFSVNIRRLDY